jgi:hypothetical protein
MTSNFVYSKFFRIFYSKQLIMTQIIIWMVAAYGMTTILVYGSIFESTRQSIHKWGNNPFLPLQGLGKFISGLISCMLCTSTWVGFFFSLCLGGLTTQFGIGWLPAIFFDGMFTAGSVWAINAIVEFFEESRITK